MPDTIPQTLLPLTANDLARRKPRGPRDRRGDRVDPDSRRPYTSNMTKTTREILERSLSLPAESRALIAQKLISSLDDQSDEDASKLWILEIKRRSREMDDGTADSLNWTSVRRSILRKLSK